MKLVIINIYICTYTQIYKAYYNNDNRDFIDSNEVRNLHRIWLCFQATKVSWLEFRYKDFHDHYS